MHVFDASSMIYAWDNYPVAQFPPLWDWMAERIRTSHFSIPQVALREVRKKSPDCGTLVSDEAKQFKLPDVRAKYKIPAVCDLAEVTVPCIPFITLIKQSGAVFT